MQSSIAVIIPVFNRPHLVLDALMCVARQTCAPRRLIVVDDGSTDGTVQAVSQWIKQMDLPFACQLIEQTNHGAGAARNAGVAAAGDCKLLAFLDSDDLWPEDYLQRMATVFERDTNIVAASTDRQDRDCAKNRVSRHHIDWIAQKTTEHILEFGSPGTPNTMIRRDAFEKVGGFDVSERCGEDYHLILRLSLLGDWAYVPGHPVGVRRGLQSNTDNAPNLSKLYPDRRLRLANILDRFIHEDGGIDHVPEKVWKYRLGRLWFSAGRTAFQSGDRQTAVACLTKAHAYLPYHLRASWMLYKARRHAPVVQQA